MPAQPDRTPATEPSALILRCVKALNAGDLDKALMYFADDAEVQLVGLRPGQPCSLKAREPLRAWFQELVDQCLSIEAEGIETRGGVVTVGVLVWSVLTRQLGVAPLVATGQILIQGGQIRSAQWTVHPESAAKLQAALSHAREYLTSEKTQSAGRICR